MSPKFFCYPVRAGETNPDGSPALINECALFEAEWIGVYRTNPDHETNGQMPSEWILDLPVNGFPDYTLRVAEGLCELLNAVTPADALHNPKLHVFFE